MNIPLYLFIDRNKSIRITKKDARPNPTELGMQIILEIPDVFFRRPIPKVNLQLDQQFFLDPSQEVTAKFIAPEVAQAMALEVKAVEDGLVRMIKEQAEEK